MRGAERCPDCDQPMLRKGQKRTHPDAYRHAAGCPSDDASPTSAEELDRLMAEAQTEGGN